MGLRVYTGRAYSVYTATGADRLGDEMTTTTCPCMPEYNGPCEVANIAQGECLDCGYKTTDHHDLLMWNGYGDHAGPTWSESCKRSRWTMTDGTVTDVDEDGPTASTLNLETLATLVTERGFGAYVEQTGGGCATLIVYGSDGTDLVYAGPGWFEGPGWTEGRADWEDFNWGTDEEDPTDVTFETAPRPLSAVADDIVALAKRVQGANEIAADRWCCGSCGLQFAHDEGVHTVQYGTFHEFVCNSCLAAERANA